MKVRRSKQSGVRDEVLRRVRGLEARCEALQSEIDVLGFGERLRQAMRRIADLEEREHRRAS